MTSFGLTCCFNKSSKRLLKLFERSQEYLIDEFDIITVIRRERRDKLAKEPVDIDVSSEELQNIDEDIDEQISISIEIEKDKFSSADTIRSEHNMIIKLD